MQKGAISEAKRAETVTQTVEHLPSKCKARQVFGVPPKTPDKMKHSSWSIFLN
jgi:hypothetical protein